MALASALRAGHPGAMEALYDRYAPLVERVLMRVLGPDAELYDLLQDVFIKAFTGASSIKDGQALRAWLTSTTVFTARQRIRKRHRRRAYWVRDSEQWLEVPIADIDPSRMEVLRATYQVLSALPADDRIVFSLRYIEGMEMVELAEIYRVSLSTVKRRMKRAETRFRAASRRFPPLIELMDQGESRRSS